MLLCFIFTTMNFVDDCFSEFYELCFTLNNYCQRKNYMSRQDLKETEKSISVLLLFRLSFSTNNFLLR